MAGIVICYDMLLLANKGQQEWSFALLSEGAFLTAIYIFFSHELLVKSQPFTREEKYSAW